MKKNHTVKKARCQRLQISRLSDVTPTPENKNYGSMTNSFGCVDYGYISMMGRRRVMEDALTVAPQGWPSLKYSFFGVYDGHGGEEVAELCQEKMHDCLLRCFKKEMKIAEEGRIDWDKVMEDCFSFMDREITGKRRRSKDSQSRKAVGSTALVVLVGEKELVVGNYGNSKAMLCRDGVAIALTSDESSDHSLKPCITSDPEVIELRRTEMDEFLIIATDGLFSYVSNQTACELVKRFWRGRIPTMVDHENSQASKAAALLATMAIAAGSKDNISIIVVFL